MAAGTCEACGKTIETWLNYCSWDCHVDLAKRNGGRIIAPNGLPIMCVMADGTMLEVPGGDHPTYIMPVEIEWIGEITPDAVHDAKLIGCGGDSDKDVRDAFSETHALIYTDRNMALTMYECCYAMWALRDGRCLGGALYQRWVNPHAPGSHKMTQTSINKIDQYMWKRNPADEA